MMSRIDDIWDELTKDSTSQTGLLYKRYSPKVIPNILVGIKLPERSHCIIFHVSGSACPNIRKWKELSDIRIDLVQDEKQPDKVFLLLILTNEQHADVFATLSEDLITGIATVSDEKILIQNLLTRLEKWESLFNKIAQQGLSKEAQRGLYGELFFLRSFLNNSKEIDYCINSWHGPEGGIQDFFHATWAVEIKTTHGKNHQKILISNERQLDTTFIKDIFLYHLALEERDGNGETLNEIIDCIDKILKPFTNAYHMFKLKLLETGYFKAHLHLYNDSGFFIRQNTVYRVFDDFPRLIEKDIPNGVGDVSYTIMLPNENKYLFPMDRLLDLIRV
jgi:hypothetical protein